ncbi:hypothetical protein FSP39_002468 [Pinctada imbricata]|uniref:Helix-turn-helix domain-containing protein n=1 Tax=Pinctada imbricata TaxID=66713 RepID=A0AA89BUF4_PINIB|nr:hypothetical protein FSP39_002468 [Pinctada imbricata]
MMMSSADSKSWRACSKNKKERPLRTIVNGIGTPTERMAHLAERELNDYVTSSPSYIKDTTDFLIQLEALKKDDSFPENPILFCFDIVKLYPSIPKTEGLAACKVALEKRSRKDIHTDAVMEMIKSVLENNVFAFNNESYHQIEGVAIGSRLGRNYACTYMRSWDEELAKFQLQPYVYKRYIDDGFGIWTHGQEKLDEFYKYANSIHPNIKVEIRYSREQIEFLDTVVKLHHGKIITDLYTKPTDKHIYVQCRSDHPNSTKRSIPYGLGLRIKRICSEETGYLKHRRELKHNLRKRGYSSKFLERELSKVDKLKRSDILGYRHRENEIDRVPLVLTYAKQLPDVRNITHKHMNILHKSEKLQKIFKSPPILAFRRGRNLGDVLVHGKHNKIFKEKGKPEVTCSPKCKICPLIMRSSSLKTNNTTVKLNQYHMCKTWNAVYGIRCDKCDQFVYVGETERSIGERLKEHLADVTHGRNKSVPNHFNQNDHSIKDIKIAILERCLENSRYYRKTKEIFWIDKLNTGMPLGLNKKSQLGVLWPDY